MAESEGGGLGLPVIVLVGLLAAAFFFPPAAEVIFQWVPATTSVITGVPLEGDLRNERELFVALESVRPESQIAQAIDAYGSAPDQDAAQAASPTLEAVSHWWNAFTPLSIFISLLLLTGALYSAIEIFRIRQHERAQWEAAAHPVMAGDVEKTVLRWDRVIEHANSVNPNDWRHAIIEADIMLDELLTVQGYRGETVGDKMKQVERSDFNTIDLAWDAHKVRNRVAHLGSEHELNDREVRRVIGLYEQVFREFHFI